MFHTNRRTDTLTDMTVLIVDFRNYFADASERLVVFTGAFHPVGSELRHVLFLLCLMAPYIQWAVLMGVCETGTVLPYHILSFRTLSLVNTAVLDEHFNSY